MESKEKYMVTLVIKNFSINFKVKQGPIRSTETRNDGIAA